MANRLANETSPYLLQHKDNPVDWHPWGEEALARAKAEDRPILLSIGYSACHWCHVMEHESFEDPGTAAFMNANFVPVKVDREERPDLDAIYMESVQQMTGQGGWPMTVFLDPDQVPFYGGTYYPKEPRPGMPSFMQVMQAVAEAWRDRRAEIESASARTHARLAAAARLQPSREVLDPGMLDEAVRILHGQFDPEHGGFGRAPKFPPASTLEFLLRRHVNASTPHALEMVERTLDGMARGGMWDVVGGGFARYSVDPIWLVPHFEKMLYDNALLARAYLHGFQVTGNERYRQVCVETLDWALREMWGPQGGFTSALDADSEGEEGRFYIWTVAELRAVLGDEADTAIRHWGASERGNFEGRNILTVADPAAATAEQVARWRERLYEVRRQRVWPGLDDKRLTSWNALMIAALADAGAALELPRYTDAARTAAEFVLRELRGPDGRLLRTYKDGRGHLGAYLEDHAFLVEALIALYEATFEARWYSEARALADAMLERFADGESGGFFTTASDHEQLVVRRKDVEDHPIPSGNSSAAFGLLRLAALSGEASYEQAAVGVFRLLHPVAAGHPQAFAHLLCALDYHLSPAREVAIAGAPGTAGYEPLLGALRSAWRPGVVAAAGAPDDAATSAAVPLLEGRGLVDERAAAYVCERFACKLPVTDPPALERELAEGSAGRIS